MGDERFMERALRLALKAHRSEVKTNPLVGCVIERNGSVVGEGWHKRFGGAHAEANALRAAGRKADGATMHVTLEPCCHEGEEKKTPCCMPRIAEAGIKKVFVGMPDPNPKVNGKGIAELRRRGVKVEVLGEGKLKEKIQEINKFYITASLLRRPFALLKLAISADGKIGYPPKSRRKWISSQKSRLLVQKLRKGFDAVLCGIGTILADNPRLTCRINHTKQPLRVVIDSKARIPLHSRCLLNEEGNTLIACTKKAPFERLLALAEKGAIVLVVKEKKGEVDLKDLFSKLALLGVQGVLVEGGARIAESLLEEKLVDSLVLFIAPKKIPKGVKAPAEEIFEALRGRKITLLKSGRDFVLETELGSIK
ncbi:MAG: bifunctional diaminohydroxyphosphoribosylaminopyrimidine deaminase/5-amino-6-(5-phosphoribosylamino)uracil reductase RibD [Candidatus Diapherotrites archaeon]